MTEESKPMTDGVSAKASTLRDEVNGARAQVVVLVDLVQRHHRFAERLISHLRKMPGYIAAQGESEWLINSLDRLRSALKNLPVATGVMLAKIKASDTFHADLVSMQRQALKRAKEADTLKDRVNKLEGYWRQLLEQAKEESALAQHHKKQDKSNRGAVGRSIVWNTVIITASAALAGEGDAEATFDGEAYLERAEEIAPGMNEMLKTALDGEKSE